MDVDLEDFVPTLQPASFTQWGVNTIYAAAAGAYIVSRFDVPAEYGALGVGGAYAVVTGPQVAVNSAYKGIDNIGKAIGVEGAGDAVRNAESNLNKWWDRVVEGKSEEEVYGKGASSRKGNDPQCFLTKDNLKDPTFFQRCMHK